MATKKTVRVAKLVSPSATVANDSATASVRGVAERSKVWTALESNEKTGRNLMIEGLKACARFGLTSGEELQKYAPTRFSSAKSAEVVASSFNAANKATQVIGETATVDLIDKATKLAGTAWVAALAALRSVTKAGKARTKAGKKGMASGAEAKRIVTDAVSAAGAELAKAPRKAGEKSPATPVADTVAAFAADYAALIIRARKLAAPAGRETLWVEALNNATRAAEGFGQIAKKRK